MRVLTGDRPTGVLHLGHYVGSLKNRLLLQELHEQFILIADVQALTDNYQNPEILSDNINKILACYLAVGLNHKNTAIFIQSMIPELFELTVYFMNLVSVNRLSRNPTVKEEIQQKGFGENLSVGFFSYPISQAADILLFNTDFVPVGNDQLPMIEQTNEIARSFNYLYKTNFFSEVKPVLSDLESQRLMGTDGKAKMSKSLHNALFLNFTEKELFDAVMKMYTDPNHHKISDPGRVLGNTVFTYLDIFDQDKEELAALKKHYEKGGLGDVTLKKRLFAILNEFLMPVRERYNSYYSDTVFLKDLLHKGNAKVKKIASENIKKIREIMKINY